MNDSPPWSDDVSEPVRMQRVVVVAVLAFVGTYVFGETFGQGKVELVYVYGPIITSAVIVIGIELLVKRTGDRDDE